MPEAQQPQAPSQDDSKQLKKLLESHLTVLEHKLGRPPTMEELTTFLNGSKEAAGEGEAVEANGEGQEPKAEETGEEEPKVLGYKVYTGMKSEGANKVPDPRRVLFYETSDGRCYDTTRHEWCPERPGILDHLQSRPMLFDEQGHDIMSALVHGVLDDEDFGALDKAQMLNEHHKKVWDLNKQLQSQMSQLEKSQETEESEESEASEKPEENASSEEKNDYGSEAFEGEEAPPSAPVQQSEPGESGDVRGENVLEQIISAALQKAAEMNESRIRQIVGEEFRRLIEMLEGAGEEPTQEFETETDPAG